ncbi:MAG: hypothetical protein H0X42_13850 [Solirubrobacterales bacterium]|nr:hypothetical protein [Solirubrobacterales bacterium]
MDVETAIRSRRTRKAFAPEPLPRELRAIGLLNLGYPRQERPVPARPGADETVAYLD